MAARTGQSQSEVSEIVAGHRRVESHPVLVRIARGLDIPPSSWACPGGLPKAPTVVRSPSRSPRRERRRAYTAAHSSPPRRWRPSARPWAGWVSCPSWPCPWGRTRYRRG
ncbi:MAG: hypothetical protein ACRDRU_06815 [Pseudonocardiaceae bacterium]